MLITNGTYYVAQASPNETNDAYANAAVSILNNNAEIAGEGKTETTLIGYNRATTVFCLGAGPLGVAQCTNFTLRDMTIEGQPHEAVYKETNTSYDSGQLAPGAANDLNPSITNAPNVGAPTAFWGYRDSQYAYNILITNCQFLYGWNPITLVGPVSNIVIRDCDFNMWGGTNANFGNVGIMGSGYNVVVISNRFNGNTNLLASTNYFNTNNDQWIAPAGLIWLQYSGNVFIARNAITNYLFEGIFP